MNMNYAAIAAILLGTVSALYLIKKNKKDKKNDEE